MSERGVYAVDRGIFDHPFFAPEPFTEREAWQWLIAEAAYKPRTRNVAGKRIDLKPGQLVASVRFMAERWQWSKGKVERFLHRLKCGQSSRGGRPKKTPENPPLNSGTMIETATETGILVITICNYAKYQRVSLPAGTDNGTQAGTAAGQQRDKRENNKNIEDIIITRDDDLRQASEAVCSDLEAVLGIDQKFIPPEWCGARMRVEAWLRDGISPETIRESVTAQARRKGTDPPRNPKYYERGVVAAHARAIAPVPKPAEINGAKNATAANPSGDWRARRDSAHAAKAKLSEAVRRLGSGDGGDRSVVRMVPDAGHRRP